ncbi:Lrp/AsnC family transcriptional regulator [Lachnoclostridium phytofermentans]|uniref:Transcriptional regulator, AsnC family n=1 Tax=Lachnoclostridium phytofermentans (strain ATCC 700394 / DSM 18823 / ISDg) TaxID=357809 RepID=A9KSE8_LACP7|nr:Lrp/AsnC family transcriptional regulator [Lachnoclostridium phytofermentans]ABX42180.1 transcriptional regulator, AsnC family [Lachnoclostridium phytofermentans ISDg]
MYLNGLDEVDRTIISLLTKNARMSYVDIGEAVGLSRVAVKTRICALEERGIIEEYTTIINPQKISSAVSSYYEIEIEPRYYQEVIDILEKNDRVTQIYQVSGKNKLHVHAVAEDNDGMEEFLNSVMYKLPGVLTLDCNIILSRIKDIKGLRL